MRSIPQALMWETLSHGRWSLSAFFLLGNAIPLLVYTAFSRYGVDPNDRAFIAMQFSFLELLIFEFGIGIVMAQGPMSRLYTAPISASSLVAWHMFSGAVLLAAETAAAAWLYNFLFDVHWPILPPALFAAATWSAFQLLFTASIRQSLTSFFIGGIPGVFLFLWLQSRYGAWFSTPRHYWSEVTASECASLAGIVAVSYAATVWGVRRTRCGEGLPSLGIGDWLERIWEAIASRKSTIQRPFPSAARALFWYQWELKGRVLPLIVSVFLLFAGVGWLLDQQSSLGTTLEDWHRGLLTCAGVLPFLAIGAGFFLGMPVATNAVRQRDVTLGDAAAGNQWVGMGHFEATRPVSNSDFAKAVLKTAAWSSLIAWGIWLAVFVSYSFGLWLAGLLPRPILPSDYGAWYLSLSILGMWVAMANFSVIGLSGRSAVVSVVIVCLIVASAVLLPLISEYVSPSVRDRIAWSCLAMASAGIVSATIWAFAVASRKRILEWKDVLIAAAVACGIAGAAFALKPVPLTLMVVCATLAFAALVVMPIATVPLAIAWNRHR